ncbi:MAG: hypothetical protein AAGA56_22690 [Myxococcota bacterium]
MSEFEHHASFEGAVEETANLDLDRYEGIYQELFREALEDGVITTEERAKLKRAASELGIDPERLGTLENALRSAYEANHGTSVLDTGAMFSRGSVAPKSGDNKVTVDFVPTVVPPPAPTPTTYSAEDIEVLVDRIAHLEDRVRELERELEDARNQISYEVDFSDIDAPVPSSALEGPEALHRRLRHDPRDAATLQGLYYAHQGNPDRQLCVALALDFVGETNPEQKELLVEHRPQGLISPRAAVDGVAWRRYLFHPDDEVLTSDILSVIVSALLLAHSAALKQRGLLPELDPKTRLDPEGSTVQVARCFGWAAKTLAMAPPALYPMKDHEGLGKLVASVPPALGLGKKALSGRSAQELAFYAGQQLAYFRPERFIRRLVPDIVDLQDIFLAALRLGNPALPLNAEVRRRVEPITSGLTPLLASADIDKLRGAYKRFVEQGGMANLQRWAVASDRTAIRTGFLLAGDLRVAEAVLALGEESDVSAHMDDLLVFVTSERYARLRDQLGLVIDA